MTTLRYSYRFYPTDVQRKELAQLFGCVRVVYNWGIDCARQARADGEKLPGYSTLSSLLTQLKRSEPYRWLADVSCVPLQQSLRHLRAAFSNMFEGRARKPRYKSRRDVQSAEFTKSAMRVDGESVKLGRITKQCSGCGHRVESLPLSVRKWRCQTCGAFHDRDINAAINVKIAAGLAEIQNARGGETPFQLPLAFG